MKQVKVYVAGKSYLLQTNDEVGYIVDLGKQLDQKVRELLLANAGVSVTDACVLTALDIMDQQGKAGHNSDNLRQEAQDYIHRANKVNEENLRLIAEIERLTAENERLQNALSLETIQNSLR